MSPPYLHLIIRITTSAVLHRTERTQGNRRYCPCVKLPDAFTEKMSAYNQTSGAIGRYPCTKRISSSVVFKRFWHAFHAHKGHLTSIIIVLKQTINCVPINRQLNFIEIQNVDIDDVEFHYNDDGCIIPIFIIGVIYGRKSLKTNWTFVCIRTLLSVRWWTSNDYVTYYATETFYSEQKKKKKLYSLKIYILKCVQDLIGCNDKINSSRF